MAGRGRRQYGETGFEQWGGYMAAKKHKLERQFASTVGRNAGGLFQNVAIFVNGLTNPSASELKQIMLDNGGIYHHYYKSQCAHPTTHIIASNLPNAKVKEHLNKTVVKPEWITESMKAGKLLDHRPFLLLQEKRNPLLSFPSTSAGGREAGTSTQAPTSRSDDEDFDCDAEVSAARLARKAGETHLEARDFIKEFYNKSRLHHISEMKAIFKDYVQQLQDQPDDGFPEREKFRVWCRQQAAEDVDDLDSDDDLMTSSDETVIAHVDMDCFFVSVGLRSRPELRGKPVAVTHSRGGAEPAPRPGEDRAAEVRGYRQRRPGGSPEKLPSWAECGQHGSMAEIASCSYEARAAGIKNGMFMGAALQRCPDLQTIPYDFESYKQVARELYGTVASLTHHIQAVSCDELLVDCTDLLQDPAATPHRLASYIRRAIQRRTDCSASIGLGPNILVARLATRRAKPAGQFHVTSEQVADFIRDQKVSDLPGVGPSTTEALFRLGAATCRDLQQLTLGQLQSELGPRTGEQLFNFCRGRDSRKVAAPSARKSVSAEVNYGIRFGDASEMTTFVRELCEELHTRMTSANFAAEVLTVKVMVRAAEAPEETAKFLGHGLCDTMTKSIRLVSATRDLQVIQREVKLLLDALYLSPPEVRGLGLQATRTSARPDLRSVPVRCKPTTPKKVVKLTPEQVLQYLGIRPQEVIIPRLPEVPSFCGTKDLTCIRKLMLEWLDSGPAPGADDVEAVTSYLTSLVEARMLEQSSSLLTQLMRNLARRDGSAAPWRGALLEIAEAVQVKVLQLHGAKLSLPSLNG